MHGFQISMNYPVCVETRETGEELLKEGLDLCQGERPCSLGPSNVELVPHRRGNVVEEAIQITLDQLDGTKKTNVGVIPHPQALEHGYFTKHGEWEAFVHGGLRARADEGRLRFPLGFLHGKVLPG